MIYYLLTVLAMSGDPLWEDDRLYTFKQCRSRRIQEITYYQVYENQNVYALCTQREKANG